MSERKEEAEAIITCDELTIRVYRLAKHTTIKIESVGHTTAIRLDHYLGRELAAAIAFKSR